ncbi:MAG: hypothetical protein BWZ02_00043 [Lentisphaerae bacterium ADurb.BinA184]|nr:MAG: hypothetical protein BWZ02_00043 [Lentisphaerae bacterium ADurb.BinA184]
MGGIAASLVCLALTPAVLADTFTLTRSPGRNVVSLLIAADARAAGRHPCA